MTFWTITTVELAAVAALIYGVSRLSVTAAIITGALIVLGGAALYDRKARP